MTQPDSILIIRFKSMGDIVFTLPAVDRLRRCFPSARLVYLVSKEHAPVVAGFSQIDEVIEVDRAAFRRQSLRAMCVAGSDLFRRLRNGRYGLAIDFQSYGETALLTWLTRARERWGWFDKPVRRRAYTRAIRRRYDMHPADWFSFVLSECGLRAEPGGNVCGLPPNGDREAGAFLREHDLDPGRPILLIQPFTSARAKDWPLEKLRAVASHYRNRGCHVVFAGGPGDRERLASISSSGFPVSAGISLSGAAGLAARATVVLGGDTGLLHLAVALGQRVVMLIGSSAPGACVPYAHPDWALTPASGEPVSAMKTSTVIAAIDRAFASTKNLLQGESEPQ